MGYTVASEWFAHEIEVLSGLEVLAIQRLERAKEVFDRANKEFIAAKEELESIDTCKKEFIWQLAHTGGKE